jgi:hypothetical protein
MKTYMLWHGGCNYSAPTVDDLEIFDSLSDAMRAFRARADFDPYYPCIENPEAWLFFAQPENDLYPDRVLTLGPRGGVRVE